MLCKCHHDFSLTEKDGPRRKERISIKPDVCHGKPVIKGTRVLVANILGALGSVDSIEEVLEDYPHITPEDVYAAMDFGAELPRFEQAPYEGTA
jgi:uncharacterized protein (DUF433 family)